ncbi:MAG TPA: hypothetical protein VFG73_02770 [Rhodanobacteraceae bacterium]|nr:hypothetical protein [Rhodanobacteraceae bacterium]
MQPLWYRLVNRTQIDATPRRGPMRRKRMVDSSQQSTPFVIEARHAAVRFATACRQWDPGDAGSSGDHALAGACSPAEGDITRH